TLDTGVVVARTTFVEEHQEVVSALLEHYQEEVDYVNYKVEEAAQLVGKEEVVTAEVAQKALPECNIVVIEGAEMKEKLSGYLSVLFEQNRSEERRVGKAGRSSRRGTMGRETEDGRAAVRCLVG